MQKNPKNIKTSLFSVWRLGAVFLMVSCAQGIKKNTSTPTLTIGLQTIEALHKSKSQRSAKGVQLDIQDQTFIASGHGQPVAADQPIPTELKEYWGELKQNEINNKELAQVAAELRLIHVNSTQNGNYPLIAGYNSLLKYSEPSLQIMSLAMANDLGLKVVDKTTLQGMIGAYQLVLINHLDLEAYLKGKKSSDIMALQSKVLQDLKLSDVKEFDNLFTLIDRNMKSIIQEPYSQIVFLNGFMNGLDPHSRLQPKKEVDELSGSGDVEIVGIGVNFEANTSGLKITRVIKDGGADTAGVKVGDVVIQINDEPVDLATHTQNEWVQKIRGAENSVVDVVVLRKTEQIKFTITRKKVVIKNVEQEILSDNRQLIRLGQFSGEGATDISSLLKSRNDQGLVLDLRGNPGGLVKTAVDIVEFFLGKNDQEIFYALMKDPKLNKNVFGSQYKTEKEMIFNGDLVVLVDTYSASASEVTSMNLQYFNRAMVIGTETFGKGTMQSPTPITKNLYVTYTSGMYFVAGHNTPQFTGVQPHVIVENLGRDDSDATKEKDYPGALLPMTGKQQALNVKSERMEKASSCVAEQKGSVKDQLEKQVLASGVVDFQLEMAKKALDCLAQIQ